jgi:hypothetical protein
MDTLPDEMQVGTFILGMTLEGGYESLAGDLKRGFGALIIVFVVIQVV